MKSNRLLCLWLIVPNNEGSFPFMGHNSYCVADGSESETSTSDRKSSWKLDLKTSIEHISEDRRGDDIVIETLFFKGYSPDWSAE